MLHRRKLLVTAFALTVAPAFTLSSCDADDTTKTVQDILDAIKKTCNFSTTAAAIIPIILTVVSTVDAAAGAAATVAASVATQVVNMVCAAVNHQVAQNKSNLKKATQDGNKITVVVNGREITGEYTGG